MSTLMLWLLGPGAFDDTVNEKSRGPAQRGEVKTSHIKQSNCWPAIHPHLTSQWIALENHISLEKLPPSSSHLGLCYGGFIRWSIRGSTTKTESSWLVLHTTYFSSYHVKWQIISWVFVVFELKGHTRVHRFSDLENSLMYWWGCTFYNRLASLHFISCVLYMKAILFYILIV